MKTKEQIEQEYGIHVGDKYGELTVVDFPVPLGEGELESQTGVSCVCSCGNKKVLSPYRLSSGDSKSCGCGKYKTGAYVGLRSGKLEIVRLFRKETKGGNQLMAHVRCDCGNEKDLFATAIVQGNVASCGCEWRKIPHVGDRCGKLTIVEKDVAIDKWGNHLMKCRCDCGNTITMKVSRWNRGKSRHCGCEKKKPVFINDIKIGDRFGKLTIIEKHIKDNGKIAFLCHCDCGKDKVINGYALTSGHTKSCGCIRLQKFVDKWHKPGFRQGNLVVKSHFLREHKSWYVCQCDCGRILEVSADSIDGHHQTSCGKGTCCAALKHGDSRTRLYRIFKGMRDRCTNAHSYYYKWYGARGIRVCDEWKDWMTFKKWALENGYREDLSIDRTNPDGDYCPENCKWSTTAEQNRNKRTTPHYAYQGKSMTIAEWERELKMPQSLLRSRIRAGWDFAEAVEAPRFRTRGWRERERVS